MKNRTLLYLGYNPKQDLTLEMNNLINEVIEEVKKISKFSYVYQKRNDELPFFSNPAYQELLKGCDSYILVATTLGFDIDKKIKHYQISDPTRALIFDAASSACLEYLADEYEEKNFILDRTYRFCPGYQNTSLDDNKVILDLLVLQKPNISILESKMLLPSKSMIGIIGLGKKTNKSCINCLVKDCVYKKGGVLCFKK